MSYFTVPYKQNFSASTIRNEYYDVDGSDKAQNIHFDRLPVKMASIHFIAYEGIICFYFVNFFTVRYIASFPNP